jgi:hypothetical protein
MRRGHVYRTLWCKRCLRDTRHSRAVPDADELMRGEGLSLNVGAIEEALNAPWKCVKCGSLVAWHEVDD